jgi:glycosyltransferase involved in cell wall biosynthesis
VYPNGIAYDGQLTVPNCEVERNTVPEFVFVAGEFTPWQGLDVLTKSIAESSSKFILHLVGRLSSRQQAELEGDDRMVCHGRLDGDAIQKIYQSCWLGIASFGLFRKGLEEACTLKVREYLMSGLPVYSGHTDVFPENFPYYKNGPANIDDILAFANGIKDVSRAEISIASESYISKDVLLLRLYKLLEQLTNGI